MAARALRSAGMSAPFFPARLAAARIETPYLRYLRLEVPPAVYAGYRIPGQFLEVRLPGEEAGAYFAIANRPDADGLELLVKRGEGPADLLFELPVGSEVEVSEAMGPGFPLEQARGKDVLLFATGSGFAPIRAMLQAIRRERDAYGAVHLFFGVRTEVDVPFRQELDALAAQGIELHLTISRLPEPTPGHGRYVQERFRNVLPPVADAVAYLCGIEGMVRGVTETLLDAGMPPPRVHVNL